MSPLKPVPEPPAPGFEPVRMVEVELADGALLRLATIRPDPGYGFLTLVPHAEHGEPQELIVPIGAIRQLTLRRAEPESAFGFGLPSG